MTEASQLATEVRQLAQRLERVESQLQQKDDQDQRVEDALAALRTDVDKQADASADQYDAMETLMESLENTITTEVSVCITASVCSAAAHLLVRLSELS